MANDPDRGATAAPLDMLLVGVLPVLWFVTAAPAQLPAASSFAAPRTSRFSVQLVPVAIAVATGALVLAFAPRRHTEEVHI